MNGTRLLKRAALALACGGMLLPPPVWQAMAAEPEAAQPARAADVALRQGGVLMGQVVDAEGQPIKRSAVRLRQYDRDVAQSQTDAAGYFVLSGLRGGNYQIIAERSHASFRFWAPGTAPPNAQAGALIVVGDGTVRGQTGPIGYWLGNPWVIAGLIAAAVAIPVAIHNDRVDRNRIPGS